MKTPPLTTAYLCGWLKKRGHDPFQLDWNIELFHHAPLHLKEYWDRTHLHQWQDEEHYRENVIPNITGPSIHEYAGRILAHDQACLEESLDIFERALDLTLAQIDSVDGRAVTRGS